VKKLLQNFLLAFIEKTTPSFNSPNFSTGSLASGGSGSLTAVVVQKSGWTDGLVKKHTLKLCVFLGLMGAVSKTFAQVPAISYPSSPYAFPESTSESISAPTNTGGTVSAANAGWSVIAQEAAEPTYYAFAITTTTGGTSYILQNSGNGTAAQANIYQVVGAATTTMTISGATLINPSAIGLDGAGNLYVADKGADVVYKFTISGTTATRAATIGTAGTKVDGGIYSPQGLAFDASNNVYIADYQDGGSGDGVIFKVAAGSTTVTSYITNLNNPYGVAVDGSGNTFVSQSGTNTVLKINGSTRTTIAGTYTTPQALTTDAGGDVFIADEGAGVKEVSAANVASTIFTTVLPGQISFDGSRNMWVADLTTGNVWESAATALFAITGTLPTGLTFNTATGAITGATVNAVSAATAYTVTAYNSSGISTCIVIISVNAATGVPTISYTGSPYNYTQNTAITNLTPTVTNTPTTYSISPALPTGLTFTTTGVNAGRISGTPTVYSPYTKYTITVSNARGSGYAVIYITVNALTPVLTYPTPPAYATNTAITLTPTGSGGTTTSVTISSALPTGLSISSTGVITGSVSSPGTYGPFTVTPTSGATTGVASNSFSLNFSVQPVISYTTPYRPTYNVAFSLAPTVTAGTPVSYSYTGTALPGTVTFSTTTGTFSGTVPNNTTYTEMVTATNSNGLASAPFTVVIRGIAPPAFTYTSPGAYTAGTAITALSPSATVTNAAVSPTLPAGLSISSAGVITGTPTAVTASATYTITALIGGAYESAPVTISVVAPAAPTLSYAGTPYTFTAGVTNTTVNITAGGGTVTSAFAYTLVSGAIPAGITFNPSNGSWTCAPTATGAFTATVNATNYVNVSATPPAAISITVNGATAPVLSYSPTSYNITYGASVNATINNAGSGVTSAYSYTVTNSLGATVSLPAGLTFSTSTGAITGIPYVSANSPLTITTTGSNSAGAATTNAVLLLTVNPASVTITATGPALTYGTAFSGSTGATNYSNTALIAGDAITSVTLTPTTAVTATTAAGTAYTVVPSAAVGTGGFSSTNYNITYTNYNSTIAKAALTIAADNINKVYGTTLTSPVTGSTAFTPTGLQNGETIGSVTIAYGMGSAAAAAIGTYTGQVTATAATGGTFNASNYSITYVAGNITVTAAPPNYTYANGFGTVGSAFTLAPTAGTQAPSALTYTTPGTAFGTATNFNVPVGLAVNPSGTDVFVANNSGGNILEYTTAGVYVTTVVSGLTQPSSVAFDAAGNMYVGTNGGNVYKYNTSFALQTLTLSTMPNSVYGLAIDASGNIYVADESGQTVDKYNSSGALQFQITTTGAYIDEPINVQVDGNGNIYVLDYLYRDITEFSSTGTYIANILAKNTLTKYPFAFCRDVSGNFYVANTGAQTVNVYNYQGTAITNFTPTSKTQNCGVAVDGSGNIYLSDASANTVYKYGPTGGYFLNYVTGTTSLPPGVNFNSTSGTFTGTPTAIFSGNYTVTEYNSSVSYTCPQFSITCGSKPVITYPTPDGYAASTTAITPLTPTNTGSAVSGTGSYIYAISSGSLPSGWSLSAATGVITGTPTADVAGTYNVAITATNQYGTSTAFSIAINVVASPPVLAYNTPNYYAVNSAITALAPTNTGGAVAASQTYQTTGTVILNAASNGLNGPVGMAVDASGNLYVTNFGANSVTEYSTTGVVSTYTTGVPTGPVGIVFDASGNAYVVGQTSAQVIRFAGGISGAAAGIVTSGLSTATGIAIDASGNIYVANSGNATITKYSVSGTSATLALTYYASNFGAGFNTFTVTGGVSVDNSGNVWFATTLAGATYLGEFSPSGAALNVSNGLGTTNNYGVYLDGGGNIFITGTGGTPNGEVISSAFAVTANRTGFTTPEGIISDGFGNLYISDYGAGTVTKYAPETGYYLNGTLPPGLSFNNTNGQITGTPTAAYSGSYTVAAYTNGAISTSTSGTGTSNTFVINCGFAPVFTYTTPDLYPVNTAITTLVPSYTGTITGTWTVSPALPAGLSISNSAGTLGYITGTPTTLSAATNYIVTTSNQYGSASFPINITVYTSPAFTYSPDPDNLPQNVAMTAISPITATTPAPGGGAPTPATTTPYITTGSSFETVTKPWGMASDASGNIYVTSYSGDKIYKYGPSGGTALGTYTTTAAVTGVTVDAYGNVYALLANGYVYKYTTFGAGALFISTIYTYVYTEAGAPTTNAGYGITCDASDNLYITDEYDRDIWKYTASTGVTSILVAYGANGIFDPSGIAVDASGNVYIVDLNTQALVKYNSSGAYQSELIGGLNAPYGLYIDVFGHFFIGDAGAKTVKEYSSTGLPIQTISTTTPASPRGLTVDPSYNLYVTDYTNGTVTKYLPNLYAVSPTTIVPTGVVFNGNTGTFSGTPSTTGGPYTYTITANGINGTGGSTTETFNCYTAYDWVGTTSATWSTGTNWLSGTAPGAANTANIGVNVAFTNQPTVTASTSVGAIQIGNTGGKAATLTVNTGVTLSVVATSGGTGNITKQSDANSLQSYATGSSLAGTGTSTINAVNLAVIGSTTQTSAYTETFSSSITNLNLSGTIQLTSGFSTYAQNATFNVTGGTTTATTALTTTNAAGGTSTFGVVPTTTGTLSLLFTTPLSGLSSTGTNVTNFKNTGATINYGGAAQTFYTDAAIANLSNSISYQNISFSGTGIKSPPSGGGNLNIAGNFTNSLFNSASNYVLLTGTPVYFNGTGAQSIAAGSGTGTTFGNVTFNGSGATTIQSGMAYINDVGTLTMAGTATLNANGDLTLVSDAGGCAAVAPITSGTPISGTVNVQRYISGERGYRLLSSPVYAGTSGGNNVTSLNYLLNSLYLTGTVSGAGNFIATANPSLFLYDESFVPQYSTFYNSNFIAISSMATGASSPWTYYLNGNGANLTSAYSVPVGNGYYVFYRGNPTLEGPNITNPSYSPVLASTVTASGTLNQGQVTFKDWYSPTSSYLGATSQDFNLIGNPYASAIDLSTIQGASTTTAIYAPLYDGTNGISQFIYELNPVTNIYGEYTVGPNASSYPPTDGASQYIGSGQGFFVSANGTSSQFIFNEGAKAILTNANAEGEMARRVSYAAAVNTGSTNPLLELTMTMDSIHSEQTLLGFNPHSKTTYVFNEDAPHKKGAGLIGFSSRSSDSVLMAINSMPLQVSQTIPLNVYATNNGLYTMTMAQLTQLPMLYDVWLKDAYMNDSLDFKHNPTYAFNIDNSVPASFGTERFTLVIREDPALMVHLLSFTALRLTTGDNVAWTVENEANYTHFVVQRSTDGGKTFLALDSLVSSSMGDYSYLDTKPVQGANSYRLQMTDLNGAITYSSVITIMYANTANTLTLNGMMVYPNPTNGPMNLAITVNSNTSNGALPSPSYHIQVTNNLGVVVKSVTSAQPIWQSDVSALSPGTYFITVTNASNNSPVGKSAFVKL
jgi:hypothetical protein